MFTLKVLTSWRPCVVVVETITSGSRAGGRFGGPRSSRARRPATGQQELPEPPRTETATAARPSTQAGNRAAGAAGAAAAEGAVERVTIGVTRYVDDVVVRYSSSAVPCRHPQARQQAELHDLRSPTRNENNAGS